ncbi:MAG: T9SS type A sorting domain-containing protein [Bacteroidetes bacterium]|nr:T9SS type A sorting domain-containing protein [Bacteroidota bacterium]
MLQTNTICNDYNYTGKTILLQPSKTYSLSIGISNCNNSGNDKIAKLFIDYNNNGSFNDVNELVFTSNNVTGVGIVNANITTSNNITIGNTSLMRLIVAETNNASSFNACSTTTINGATEDYLVRFINPAIDVEAASVEIPSTNYCSNNNQYISTRIINRGDSTAENIALTATIKSGVTIIAALNGVYSPKLASGESAVYTFQNPFTTVADSNYTITVTANVVNDQVGTNNITVSTFTIKSTPQIVSGQASVCNNIASLKVFSASNTQTYAWYNNATSNMPVAVGSETSTSIISNKYYLNIGLNTSIGAINKSISSNGDYQAKGGNYFYYMAASPVLLQSAKLYTAYPGKVFIKVADTIRTYSDGTYDYTTLNATTINVIASRPIQASGNVIGNDTSDTGLVYNINLLLPQGNHILIVSTDSVANIFRNKSIGATPYPYVIPNLLTITGNNATYQDSFYYYLYNMKIRTLDCESEKYEVTTGFAALPTITKIGDSLVSSLGINYQWQKNGVDIVGETNQKFMPTGDGNYSVIVTDFNGCRQSSKVYQPNIKNDVNIYPNPSNNIINIQFNSSEVAFTQIDIYDILSRKYISKIYTSTTNSFYDKINTSFLPNGIYFIKILHGESSFIKKLIIAR